ncbi:MAG: HNH endonuclease signature motif containing protein [Nitrosarchaeum sp.]|nr:HNH endonuclease signature motif containing protein [Nitrosarchaeum sp.]
MTVTVLGLKRNRVFVDNPHPASLASLVLLAHEYNMQSVDEWLTLRKKFLKKQRDFIWWNPKTWFKSLTCHYCGRRRLKMVIKDMTSKRKLRRLATIDHVKPLSKGGAELDESNFVVACWTCNQRKGNTI